MTGRIGTRLAGDSPPDPLLFRADYGEDWVVPRERVRYLVISRTSAGAVMTAYDPAGRIVGERFAEDVDELSAVLARAARNGSAEPPRAIPDSASSALAWLDQGS